MSAEPTAEQSAEQEALRDAVRRFLAVRAGVADHVRPLLDDPTGSTEAVRRGLADLGATGLLVPTEHGGAGAGMTEAGIVLEELGAALHPGPWLSTAVAGARALTRLAGDPEAGKLLAGIADGSTAVAVGPLAVREMPVAETDGGEVVLHGTVRDLPDAAAADVLLVLAAAGDGPALCRVDAGAAGVTVTPRTAFDLTRRTAEVRLDGARAERLGRPTPQARRALADDVAVAYAADAVGAARAAVDLAVAHAKVREQFGRPIGAYQAVAHLCARMYETVELARAGVLYALWAVDHADPAERHLAVLRTRAFAGTLAGVGDDAVQVLGGLGYTWEHDAHLYLRRLLGWSAYAGGHDRAARDVGAALVRSVRLARSTR